MNIKNYNKNTNIYHINNHIKNSKDDYNTNNNIFYINTLSYNKNNNIYNTNNNIFYLNTLNYKRNNNIYNTYYYIKKIDMGLSVDACSCNKELDTVASTTNVDVSRLNVECWAQTRPGPPYG